MQYIFENHEQTQVHNAYFTRLKDIFHQNAFADIKRGDSKLRTYALLKTEIGAEQYLKIIKNIKNRTMFTKLRLSNHNLMIEKGRHQNIVKYLRLCPFCPNAIEDEIHFITNCKCKSFVTCRESLFKTISEENKILNFANKDNLQKFKILMTHCDAVQHTAEYITKTMTIRDFLLAKHKNNI